MKYPLPYAFARENLLLLEQDGERATLWASLNVSHAALSEVMRLYAVHLLPSPYTPGNAYAPLTNHIQHRAGSDLLPSPWQTRSNVTGPRYSEKTLIRTAGTVNAAQ